ncbi:unnamed protein product [Moneuplotes crassus]|uniref:Uncharacterized protein n=1 Tax=Euplotes crassus TaxID=5936 RepID=A0AAD1XED6_EUPCR|nr:unnamed protein product [Moneuplotes crassus]
MGCNNSSKNIKSLKPREASSKTSSSSVETPRSSFRDNVVQDVHKRNRMVKAYFKEVHEIQDKMNTLETSIEIRRITSLQEDPQALKTFEDLEETQKTLLDKIAIQENIIHNGITRLRIVESSSLNSSKDANTSCNRRKMH